MESRPAKSSLAFCNMPAHLGRPGEIGEHFSSLLAQHDGLDGFTINAVPNGFIEGRLELLGQTLAPLFA